MNYKLLVPAIVVIGALGAYQYRVDQQQKAAETARAAGCEPEGGLACDGSTILLCKDGVAAPAGTCPGGCEERRGVARCLDANGRIVAPGGALCRRGMGMCSLEPNWLLVCENERLVKATHCPRGCFDEGERSGLFCMNERDYLKFAPGFACPRFEQARTATKFVCGEESGPLLRCEDGLLVPHDVQCARCDLERSGKLRCLDEMREPIEPETGRKIQ